MKRYLVIFVDSDGRFCVEEVVGNSVIDAYEFFMNKQIQHDEIITITLMR